MRTEGVHRGQCRWRRHPDGLWQLWYENWQGRQDSNPRDLRFWRLVAVSAMPAYLVARALCVKIAGVWARILRSS